MAYQRWCDIASLSWYDLMVVRLITTWEKLYKVFFTATLTLALSLVASLRRATVATALLPTSSSFSAMIAYAIHSVFLSLTTLAITLHRLCEQNVTIGAVGNLIHRLTNIFVHATMSAISTGEGFCLVLWLLFAYGQSVLSMSASCVFLFFAALAGNLSITTLFRLSMTIAVTLLSGLEGALRFVVKSIPKPSSLWVERLKKRSLWVERPKKRSLWRER